MNMKLPKEYKSFEDSFEIAVNQRWDIEEVEKFTYLKWFLTGEASRAVKGLAVTTENYEEALQTLDERYGNVQIIVKSHSEELDKLPVVHNNDDTAKLRDLYDNKQIFHDFLFNTRNYSPEIINIILPKVNNFNIKQKKACNICFIMCHLGK